MTPENRNGVNLPAQTDGGLVYSGTMGWSWRRWALITCFAPSLSACGSGLLCGENTREEDGYCVADRSAESSSSSGGGGGAGGEGAATGTSTTTSSSTTGAGGGDLFLDALPPCEPVSTDGSIDLVNGCVLGACHDMTYDEMNAALGEAGVCEYLIDATLVCDWALGGIQVFLDDIDNDGVPDPGQTAFAVFVQDPFPGGTPEGLGVGATLRCFIEVLGDPETVDVQSQGGGYVVTRLEWQSKGVSVSDDYFAGYVDADGHADSIMMFGGF